MRRSFRSEAFCNAGNGSWKTTLVRRALGDGLQAEVAKLGQELESAQEKVTTVVGHRSALQALVSRFWKRSCRRRKGALAGWRKTSMV